MMPKRVVVSVQLPMCMLLRLLLGACLCSGSLSATAEPPPADLSVTQIVARHLAARGGMQAWSAIRTLSVSGKMDAGSGDSVARSMKIAREGLGASVRQSGATPTSAGTAAAENRAQLPFALEMERPDKSRLEIQFAGKTAVQVFDGANGWKLRPYLGRGGAEPFTAQEAKAAAGKQQMGGPLVESAATASKVELEGVEPVEGHPAYKLKLTTRGGDAQQVWIDSQSFLDVKVEGIPRRMDGRMHSVYVTQRDFRAVQGLMMPFLLETAVADYSGVHRMIIEKVSVNQQLNESDFGRPST